MSTTPSAFETVLADKLWQHFRERRYDPERGIGAVGTRVAVKGEYVPLTMTADPLYPTATTDDARMRLRCRHDFEYWAAKCVRIKHKKSGRLVPFILNAPQRRVLSVFESMRLSGRPIRLIMLKARQWGGSTLTQMYMAWIQTVLATNWNSIICAHVKNTSQTIRGMYSRLLDNYPENLWEGNAKGSLKPYEGSQTTRLINGRDCCLTVCSSDNHDAARGLDYAMAHLSEVAFWHQTRLRSPEDTIQAIYSGIAEMPLSLIVLESTANGVGNYFHREWMRSVAGESDKAAVFVPWYEIEFYREAVADPYALAESLNEYELRLFHRGASLENINWYRHKRAAYPSKERMFAEFPSDYLEAFNNCNNSVFSPDDVNRLRSGCREALDPKHFRSSPVYTIPGGKGEMWEAPKDGMAYIAAVDIGGRTDKADYSVISVLSCYDKPAVVAQWRGHIDHDLLAKRAADIASYYNTALLVVESNTLEQHQEGDPNLFILNRLAQSYCNVYHRETFDADSQDYTRRVGFHTNRSTKALLISNLIEMVRDERYIERSHIALDEYLSYEKDSRGCYAARSGCHDDVLMSRALALHIITSHPVPQFENTQVPTW